jgi:hypothetical protein
MTDYVEEIRRLVPDLNEHEVAGLEQKGRLEDIALGLRTVEEVAAEVRDVRADARGGVARGARPPSSRAVALWRLVAEKVGQEEEVVRFRDLYLPRGLITVAAIEKWIETNAGAKNRRTPRKLLAWAEDDDHVHRAAVAPGSPADVLRVLTDDLHTNYGWQPAQAVTFVLTGRAPLVPDVIRHAVWHVPITACSRVVLDIDPAAPPALVEQAYREARRAFGRDRFRAPTEQSVALAIFNVEHADESERARLRRWNRKHRDWRYETVEAFRRADREAQRKLLYPYH